MSFEHGALLRILAALPLLLVFYLARRRATRVAVPYLLLWDRVVAAEKRESRRIRAVLSVLLQAGAAAALIVAAAGPFTTAPGPGQARTLVVVDGSLHMAARIGAPGLGGEAPVRFAVAVARARELLAEALAEGETALAVLRADLRIVVPFTADAARLEQGLADLAPPDDRPVLPGGSEVASALNTAAAGGARVRVVTAASFPGAERLSGLHPGVSVLTVGPSAANAGIVDLRRDGTAEAGPGEIAVAAAVLGDPGGHPVTVAVEAAGVRLAEQRIDLPAGRPVTAILRVKPALPAVLAVRILDADAFTPDDTAWLAVEAPRPLRILLATDRESPFLLAALRALAGRLDPASGVVAPADWRAAAPSADVVILHGLEEREPLPDGAWVLLDSRAPGLPLRSGAGIGEAEITRVAEGDPLLRGLEPGSLSVSKARDTEALEGLEVALEGSRGPLISHGRSASGPFVHVAFAIDVDASSLVLTPLFSLLLGSAFDLLVPPAEMPFPGALRSGGALRPRSPSLDIESDPVLESETSSHPLPRESGSDVRRLPAVAPGIWKLRGAGVGQTVGVNLMSEDVTRTGSRLPEAVPDRAGASGPRREIHRPRVAPFALAGLAVLLIEWILYHRRVTE